MTDNYVIHIKGEEVESALKIPGTWIVANIDQSIGWPEEDIVIKYEDTDLFLLTYGDVHDYVPAVALRLTEVISNNEAKIKITKFLSALNWVSGGSLRINSWTGGSRPIRSIDSKNMKYTARFFRVTYIPTNLDDNQLLALALFREGDGLRYTHYGYSFLSFYKIINLVNNNGGRQKRWIRNNLDNLNKDAQQRADELTSNGDNIEDYLYHSCRCALAHAGVDPTVNPDDVSDSVRLYKDLPLIRHLAKRMIEEHFLIKSDTTVYNEHLYELCGFKMLLGEEIISEILSSDSISRRRINIEKKISIRQWCNKQYGVFESLSLKTKKVQNGVVFFECHNDDYTFKVDLILDFTEERIYLDIENTYINNATKAIQLQYNIDWNMFIKDFLCNGQVEIFTEVDNKFLGRKDANLPVNIDLGRTAENIDKTISSLQEKLDELV